MAAESSAVGHDHQHYFEHDHDDEPRHVHTSGAGTRRALAIALALTAGFAVVEAIGGWTSRARSRSCRTPATW